MPRKKVIKKLMKDREALELDQVQKEILDLVERYKILDPVPKDIDLDAAIEIAKKDLRADLVSMKDAIQHFIKSVRHLPLYTSLESYIDDMVSMCVSIENILDGGKPIMKMPNGMTPKMFLAHLLTATYNHYRATTK